MLFRYVPTITFFFLGIIVTIFAHKTQKKEDFLLDQVIAANRIVMYSPEAILSHKGDKLHIDQNFLLEKEGLFFLRLSNGKDLLIPTLAKDISKVYVSTLMKVGNKFFKCVCNVCEFEWEGGAFDIWCPQCGSSNFSIRRNR